MAALRSFITALWLLNAVLLVPSVAGAGIAVDALVHENVTQAGDAYRGVLPCPAGHGQRLERPDRYPYPGDPHADHLPGG